MTKEVASTFNNSGLANSIQIYKQQLKSLGLDVDDPKNAENFYVVKFKNAERALNSLVAAGQKVHLKYRLFYFKNANKDRIHLQPIASTSEETDYSIWARALKSVTREINRLSEYGDREEYRKELKQARKDLKELKDPKSDTVLMVIAKERMANYQNDLLDPDKITEFNGFVREINNYKKGIADEIKNMEKTIKEYKKSLSKENNKGTSKKPRR